MNSDNYRDQLLSLLPPGKAIAKSTSSGVGRMMHGLGVEAARVEDRARDLIAESVPANCDELLSEFEADFGIVPEGTTAQRKVALAAKVIEVGQQYPSYFLDIITAFGFTSTITEFQPAWAGTMVAGDACGDQDILFYWLVNVLDAGATVDDMTAMMKEILRLKPGHTQVFFDYPGSVAPLPEIEFTPALSRNIDNELLLLFSESQFNGLAEFSWDEISTAIFFADEVLGSVAEGTVCTISHNESGTLPQQDNIGNITSFNNIAYGTSQPADSLIGATLNYVDRFEGAKSATITDNDAGTNPTISFASRKDSFIAAGSSNSVSFPTLTGDVTYDNHQHITSLSLTVGVSIGTNALVGGTISWTDTRYGVITKTITSHTTGTSITVNFSDTIVWHASGTATVVGPDTLLASGNESYSLEMEVTSFVLDIGRNATSGEFNNKTLRFSDDNLGAVDAIISSHTTTNPITVNIPSTYYSYNSVDDSFQILTLGVNTSGSVAYDYRSVTSLAVTVDSGVVSGQLVGRILAFMDHDVGSKSLTITANTAGPSSTISFGSTQLSHATSAAYTISRSDLTGTASAHTPASAYTTHLHGTMSPDVDTDQLANGIIKYFDVGLSATISTLILSNTSGSTPVFTIASTAIGYINASTAFTASWADITGLMPLQLISRIDDKIFCRFSTPVTEDQFKWSVIDFDDVEYGPKSLLITGNLPSTVGNMSMWFDNVAVNVAASQFVGHDLYIDGVKHTVASNSAAAIGEDLFLSVTDCLPVFADQYVTVYDPSKLLLTVLYDKGVDTEDTIKLSRLERSLETDELVDAIFYVDDTEYTVTGNDFVGDGYFSFAFSSGFWRAGGYFNEGFSSGFKKH